jgi:uncharacterized membrane protein YcjF (UPF0283 family)
MSADQKSSIETAPLVHLSRLIGRAWTWARRIAYAAAFAGIAIFVLEWIHLHSLLAEASSWLAWMVTGLGLTVLSGLTAWIGWRWFSIPRIVTPPSLPPDPSSWSARQTSAYVRFARRYLERQRANPALDQQQRAEIPAAIERIADLARQRLTPGEIVGRVENDIDRILEPLDRLARKEIWICASQVSVLTAVNPSAMLDVLITLLRNLELMARLARLYYGRPGVLGSVRVAGDVLAVAATAGIVERVADSAASVTAEMVGSWTARLAGPVGQGITNGLLTVRLGDAAVLRCRSLRSRRVGIKPWSRTMWREMARRLADSAGERLAPEVAGAFRGASGTSGDGGQLRRTLSRVRDAVSGGREAADGPDKGEAWMSVPPNTE